MQSGKHQRVLIQITELQDQFTLLNKKLSVLKKAEIVETDPARKFQLEHEIQEIDAKLKALEK